MTKDFNDRLRGAKARSGLTIREMAHFFDGMSDQTMWSWLSGRAPKQYNREAAERNLGFLEKELHKKTSRLPLPLSVRQGDRLNHVERIRKSYR